MKTQKKTSISVNTLLVIFAIALCFLDIIFIIFTQNESKTITLLKGQKKSLAQDESIIASAKEIQDTFQNEVGVISAVFPSEETIPVFILKLEEMLKNTTDEYSVKFAATAPIKQDDKLFLPIIISTKTNYVRLTAFFTQLEKALYMTHITAISIKSPDNFIGVSDVQIRLNVYVQNPFTSK